MSYNCAQNCPASLQVKVVFPFENNQGKEAYAIFDDAAAMFRHDVNECVVDCPEVFRT